MSKPDFIPNRINAEPPAFLGLSLPEVVKISVTRMLGSISGCIIIGMIIYPHYLVGIVGLVVGVAMALFLIRRKAARVLEESRGKDQFYSFHKDQIKTELMIAKINQLEIFKYRAKNKVSLIVRDGYWAQR